MSAVAAKREALEKILGEEHLNTIRPTSMHAMEMGVVVDIHIHRWRGRSRLDFSDLGLPQTAQDQMYAHLLRLGDKKLLPKKRVGNREVSYVDLLEGLESRARRWLELKSFHTHWGRFVPHTLYAEWKKGNEAIKTEYMALGDEIVDKYDEIVKALMKEYGAMAKAAYQRSVILRQQEVDEPTFLRHFTSQIKRLIPGPDYIHASFGYEVNISFVPLPADYEKEVARAERARTAEELKTEADRANLSSLRAMNEDVIRQAKEKKLTLVDSFMTDVAVQIRSMIYDTTTDVLSSIKRNDGKLLGKTSTQLTNLINSISGLNFYGDRDVEGMINKIRSQLTVSVKDRSVSEITSTLKDIGTVTRANLLSLGDEPRRARGTGIPDVPTEAMIQRARRSLNIDVVTDRLETRRARLTPEVDNG